MKNLIIVGARGWGREVYGVVKNTKPYIEKQIVVKGFLDSKYDAFEGLNGNFPPIISAPEDYQIESDDVFFVAMGEPKWRKYYCDIMKKKGAKFYTIISPKANIYPTAEIGEGSFIGGCVVSDNVKIGEHVVVHSYCTLGHDTKIGNFSSLEAYVFTGGFSEIGELTTMHVKSTLIRHKKVGNNVSVGTNSVVIRNVSDNLHVFGNPAKKIEF